ncbi:tetratricopeptide repeat protein [Aquisalimonas asiatica]|uniref:Uncharacterized protein n=1 Tax=Aquisalimonas asiatica TaxID=406100 RepID=A0A1H8U0B3_9GAMM|nr:tetratricopeptide repeat protein [Aquisalimonas asiatica]SEO96577.1 hypothetical protein SAMN04488052_10575 [Aquisalimonas asiatica]
MGTARMLVGSILLGAGLATADEPPHWEGEWNAFPDDLGTFEYSPDELREAWQALHRRDGLPWPDADHVERWGEGVDDPAQVAETLVQGWRQYHAGDFQKAYRIGTEAGHAGNLLAGRAWLTYANHLPDDSDDRAAMLAHGVEMMEERMQSRDGAIPPWEHAGFALLLGQHSKHLSTGQAVRAGIPGRVTDHLDAALEEMPELPSALGTYGGYHTELVDRVGGALARLTYGANRDEAVSWFEKALEEDPDLVMARTEYGEALLRLDRDGNWDAAMAQLERALDTEPRDADDALERERARRIKAEWKAERESDDDNGELPEGLGG